MMKFKFIKDKVKVICSGILISQIIFSNSVFAIESGIQKLKNSEINNDIYVQENKLKFVIKTVDDDEMEFEENYTEEYKEYLKLSDDEKAKLEVVPRKYNVPLDILYDNIALAGKIDELPKKFDLREKINVQVEDQDSYGLCWDFASVKSLETNLALNGYGDYDFSELHVDYLESSEFGNYRSLHDGGNFSDFVDYLENGYGPVQEKEVPYDAEYNTLDEYDYLYNLQPEIYVNDVIDFPNLNLIKDTYSNAEIDLLDIVRTGTIKKHLQENGSIYAVIATPDFGTDYFNSETNSEYFSGDFNQLSSGREIHAISIIGYDDNYPIENFNENQRPTKPGAYIALNSWGKYWGDNGVFYISYEDSFVETQMSGVVSVTTKYDEYVQDIRFEDNNLFNALKEEFEDKIKGGKDNELVFSIPKLTLKNIFYLNLNERNIENLSGIETFEKLRYLNLNENNISNIDVIANLKKLQSLDISDNNIKNINIISNLKDLYGLNISNNKIDNIDNILSLKKLNYLSANDNEIENIDCLAKLSNIYFANFSNNNISKISEQINISELNLSGNKIQSGLENVKSYRLELNNCDLDDSDIEQLSQIEVNSLSLQNNNIKNLSFLNNLELSELDLSNNIDLQFDTIESININNIIFKNCNISELSFLEKITTLNIDLSENPIDNIPDSFKDKEIYAINLSETNIKDVSNLNKVSSLILDNTKITTGFDKLENVETISMENCDLTNIDLLSDVKELESLNLSKNPIENIPNSFKDKEIYAINLSETNIKDVSNLNKVTYLFLDKTKIETGFNKLENIESIDMCDCGLTNIDMLENIKDLDYLNLSNNNIIDVEPLSDINIGTLIINHNNIIDISVLENVYSIIAMENCISKIPHFNNDCYFNIANQKINLTYELENSLEINEFDFPDLMAELFENRYKQKLKFITDDCEINYKERKLLFNTDNDIEGVSTIKIKGGSCDGTVYTINYKTVSDSKMEGIIIVKAPDKMLYVEGQHFEVAGMKIRLYYDNGASTVLTDYIIENGDNLKKGQKEVIIKYGEFETVVEVNVYGKDEVKEIQFKDIVLYQQLLKEIKDQNGIIILNDEENKKIVFSKDCIKNIQGLGLFGEITSLFGISEFYNLSNLYLINSKDSIVDNLEELVKLKNLRNLSLYNISNEDFSFLNDLENLVYVNINNSKVRNIGNLLEKSNLSVNISSYFDSNELENDGDKIILPQVATEFKKKYNDQEIEAKIAYRLNDDGKAIGEMKKIPVTVEEDGNLTVTLDKEITEEKPDSDRLIRINIMGYNLSIYYTPSEPENTKYEVETIDDKNYITVLDTTNNSAENVLTKENFPRAEYIKAKDMNGKEIESTDKLGTGTTIELLDEGNNVIDTYTISILGDLDGNGEIDLYDIIRLIELVMDSEEEYKWPSELKYAGDCEKEDELSQPDLYDILRLIEYQFDDNKW